MLYSSHQITVFFDTNLGKFSRYGRLNSAITNFSRHIVPPHQFWPRYYSDGLSPVHIRFEIFSKQICNVEGLICHFYKNIITLTHIVFPRDADIFRIGTIFYRHYKGLHQMRKDLLLCALNAFKNHTNRFLSLVINDSEKSIICHMFALCEMFHYHGYVAKTISQWPLVFLLHNHGNETCYIWQTILNLNCLYKKNVLRSLPAKLEYFFTYLTP